MKTKKFQIFLSSTFTDLEEERESIIKAILEMYHIPIGMEMFSAEDEDQWEIIRRTIEVSDYYILILGLRYGSKTTEGISFTQKEYEYALELKIPILAFVMHDNVPLPKEKRDDNLNEIIAFREMVLSNSKMAQFWETKDQLIKNVSISLMKQIMQRPGVGWIRGDSSGNELALSNELTNLSKENRELRERIIFLESKITTKCPAINIEFENQTNTQFISNLKKNTLPNKLILSEIPSHLIEFISDTDIENFNNNIPTQAELDNYNIEFERIYNINNNSSPFSVTISNIGSTTANNIYIDIIFPEELYIYAKDKTHDFPQNIIPQNPLLKAQKAYDKKIAERTNPLLRMQAQLGINKNLAYMPTISRNIPNLPLLNKTRWTDLNDNNLTIKIDNLLHTRQITFDDEYMITPLKDGKFNINVNIICEEYDSLKIKTFELDINSSNNQISFSHEI